MHRKCLEWVAHKLHSLVVHHHWDHVPLHARYRILCTFLSFQVEVEFVDSLALPFVTSLLCLLPCQVWNGPPFTEVSISVGFQVMKWMNSTQLHAMTVIVGSLCAIVAAAIYVYYCIGKLSKFVRFWTQIWELNSRYKFVLGFYVSVIAQMNLQHI
jgi:hypothetical protein